MLAAWLSLSLFLQPKGCAFSFSNMFIIYFISLAASPAA
jgi:hypothetical protein